MSLFLSSQALPRGFRLIKIQAVTRARAMRARTHQRRIIKSDTAIMALVMAGSSTPNSAKVEVKAGTALTMTMIKTMMATMMTIMG